MIVWAYTVVRNEEAMLPWWLRCYGAFADRLIVIDDASTDSTREIAQAAGAEIRGYPFSGLDDQEQVDFARATYREARGYADWVCWSDCDEMLYHPKPRATLEALLSEGVQLPLTQGFQMYGDGLPCGPGQIWEHVRRGERNDFYSKANVFSPDIDLSFTVGRHGVAPISAVRSTVPRLAVLHYRWLGPEWFQARNARNYAHLSKRGIDEGWGEYTAPEREEATLIEWQAAADRAQALPWL